MPAIRPVRMKDRPLLSYQQSSYTSRSRALGAQTLAYRASNTRDSVASNNRISCVKQSQFYCVDNHEQPLVGESLLARTGPAGQALSPLF